MSLLTPERIPVKVYKWNDVGAPALDKSAGCMIAIFESCLVTGYGSKASAGWSSSFAATGIKVLRPAEHPDAYFYLRLSGDTGTQLTTQVYTDMTSASAGDLKLECDTPFKYAKKESTGKWLLVASPRGFWFFCDQRYAGDENKTGGFFFVGVVSGDTSSAIYLQHTGGTYDDGDYSSAFGVSDKTSGSYVSGKILVDGVVSDASMTSWANGWDKIAETSMSVPAIVFKSGKSFQVTGLLMPLVGITAAINYQESLLVSQDKSVSVVAHGGGGRAAGHSSMHYIKTDYWVY